MNRFLKESSSGQTETSDFAFLPNYSRLRGVISDINTSIDEVAWIIEQDPVLSQAILAHVNSAYYSLSNKVGDLRKAVIMMGFEEVERMVFEYDMENYASISGPSDVPVVLLDQD